MNKVIFERQTSKGNLVCQVKSRYLSQVNFEIEFYLDEVQIKKNYSMGMAMNIVPVEYLKDKAFASKIYPELIKLGAVALWNGQVSLYGNEPELIKNALEEAAEQRRHEEEQQLRATDIVVSKHLYNGSPAEAENGSFSWSCHADGSLKCKKTGEFIYHCQGLEGHELQVARKFLRDLSLIQKDAEKAYAKAQQEKDQVELEKRGENPWTKGLSLEQIKCKAKEWDDINNEGGEGYNPYYHW